METLTRERIQEEIFHASLMKDKTWVIMAQMALAYLELMERRPPTEDVIRRMGRWTRSLSGKASSQFWDDIEWARDGEEVDCRCSSDEPSVKYKPCGEQPNQLDERRIDKAEDAGTSEPANGNERLVVSELVEQRPLMSGAIGELQGFSIISANDELDCDRITWDPVPDAYGYKVFYGGLSVKPHVLYKDGDLDVPNQICDWNGEIVLAMCRNCKKAEIELDDKECHG